MPKKPQKQADSDLTLRIRVYLMVYMVADAFSASSAASAVWQALFEKGVEYQG